MNWLITQKNPKIKTADVSSPILRFADLIYGTIFRIQRRDLSRDWIVPYHFGFTDDDTFPIDEDRYLVITEYDIEAYTKVWKDIDKFEKQDFTKIDFCTNVDKIYENGEFRSYFVHKYD